jgi:hypothetical protein
MTPMPRTQKGYVLGEVISAIQKEIRRGKEREAFFWAMELCPRYEKYLWRRLIIIAHEDIGPANPLLLVAIPTMRFCYFDCREAGKDGGAKLILCNAILIMCASPKARTADHLVTIMGHEREKGLKLEPPSYAVDRHTRRGKTLGRGIDHWMKEGCVLHPPAGPFYDRYLEEWEQVMRTPGGHLKPDWGGKISAKNEDWKADSKTPLFPEDEEES